MMSGKPALLGRHDECELLDQLVERARGGWSAVRVLRGEPGVGKTALLEHAIASAAGMRIVRVTGVESESELAYAALQQLCRPMLSQLKALPGPQRDGLATAFGLAAGNAPDPFMVGLAALSLLCGAAQRSLLCVVDDAQWLDHESAQALAFVARRLQADAVAMLFATREDNGSLSGLPRLLVHGLADSDARALLASVAGVAGIDKRVRDQLIAEAGGNPLALLELAGAVMPAGLAGGFGIPGTSGPRGKPERSFLQRYQALPAPTQRLLLVAAADPTGDPVLVWNAAAKLGISPGTAIPAETGGLATFGARVVFLHPLVRSVVYQAASPPERRATHKALAEATSADVQPARRAWHRAQAALGPDEQTAAELERAADNARARGGIAAAAAFWERATELTLDPRRRAERALAAARARQQAGAFDAALAMLDAAEAGPLNEMQHAQADLLRGRVAFALNYGSDASPLLLKAASQFEPLAPALARETYLEALSAALLAGRLATGGGLLETAAAARLALPPPRRARPPDLLLDGLALLITDGYAAAAPVLRRAVSSFGGRDVPSEDGLRWLWLACHAAGLVWDFQGWDVLSARFVRLGRDTGTLTVLPMALSTRAGACLFAGELAAADSLAGEEAAVTQATGSRIAPYAPLGLAAYQGREAEVARLAEAGTADVLRRGEGVGLSFIQWAAALLHNGLGHYREAAELACQASEDSRAQRFTGWALAELIEAAARGGEPDRAADALRRLGVATQASATDWALGVEARSRALLSRGETAERLYREAIGRLGRTRLRPDLARAHLLFGEWLRRERRRLDAREQLTHAYGMFTDCGMAAFAERARIELQATGGRVRKRIPETHADLTPQEAQIARLAASSATNAEIAARLFISASTVDYHLRKVFRKLGVTSRRQLTPQALQASGRGP
jgi:DNA-binding CsgD family transcriptional regulator